MHVAVAVHAAGSAGLGSRICFQLDWCICNVKLLQLGEKSVQHYWGHSTEPSVHVICSLTFPDLSCSSQGPYLYTKQRRNFCEDSPVMLPIPVSQSSHRLDPVILFKTAGPAKLHRLPMLANGKAFSVFAHSSIRTLCPLRRPCRPPVALVGYN